MSWHAHGEHASGGMQVKDTAHALTLRARRWWKSMRSSGCADAFADSACAAAASRDCLSLVSTAKAARQSSSHTCACSGRVLRELPQPQCMHSEGDGAIEQQRGGWGSSMMVAVQLLLPSTTSTFISSCWTAPPGASVQVLAARTPPSHLCTRCPAVLLAHLLPPTPVQQLCCKHTWDLTHTSASTPPIRLGPQNPEPTLTSSGSGDASTCKHATILSLLSSSSGAAGVPVPASAAAVISWTPLFKYPKTPPPRHHLEP